MRKIFKIGFLIVAVISILEYLLICGMFTGPLMALLILIFGLPNIFLALRDRQWEAAILYILCTVALSMGYWKLLF